MAPRTVLVPYAGGPGSDEMLRMACSTAGAGGRVVVLAVTLVHRALPLRDLPAFFDEEGVNRLVRATEVAAQCGVEIDPRVRRTYDAAQTIVREAGTVHADAIFLELKQQRFRWIAMLLDKTARAVMKHAGCPVILGYFPPDFALDTSQLVAEAERILRPIS